MKCKTISVRSARPRKGPLERVTSFNVSSLDKKSVVPFTCQMAELGSAITLA